MTSVQLSSYVYVLLPSKCLCLHTAACNPRCQNGGECVNGVCHCTNEWVGSRCQQGILCVNVIHVTSELAVTESMYVTMTKHRIWYV